MYQPLPDLRLAAAVVASLRIERRDRVRKAFRAGQVLVNEGLIEDARAELAQLSLSGIDVVLLGTQEFPEALQVMPDPPLALYRKGAVLDGSRRHVAIVGSRRASHGGMVFARACGQALAQHGVVVVSGLATGIDSAAHLGALDAQGTTVAVCGSGLHHTYPAHNRPLAERILRYRGTLISEYEPDVRPRKHHFPERNRIISGLSEAVLVVEASLRSGSLVTARMALEQGRDVFAVPGDIDSETHRGCHRLIREGAALIDSVGSLLQELGLDPVTEGDKATENVTPRVSVAQQQILSALGSVEAQTLDQLAETLSCPIDRLMVPLIELELAGFVLPVSGGYIRGRTSI